MSNTTAPDEDFVAFRDDVYSSFRDSEILERWNRSNLLAQLRQKNKGRQKQVIHDIPRPPLENVTPQDVAHRVLKDIYFKMAALMGFNVTYAPSWNLFDSAVETAIAQEEHQQGRLVDAVTVRRRSKTVVAKRMTNEKALLQRLGVFADWRGIRPQLEPRYEARLLEGFGELMDRGFLRKEAKPSYWCIKCQSILTDDELVFKNRKWAAAYVRFPVRDGFERLGPDVSLLVWVVELWALPAGIAVALPKTGRYVVIDYEGRKLIIEQETAEQILDGNDHEVLEELDASELLKCTCSHPLLDAELSVVQSESGGHARKGIGVFLAIPGHNQDDYAVRLEHNYKIVSIIDDAGCLTEDAEVFCGLSVFEASRHIALQLEAGRLVMSMDEIEAPYPHCWTCESPAVFRPADQWMFDAGKHELTDRSLKDFSSMECLSESVHEDMCRLIAEHRKWGASSQRVWGLPVPAFNCQRCGRQLEVFRSVKAARDYISHKGTDAWFPAKADNILANDVTCTYCGEREFRKDTSIIGSQMATLLAAVLTMGGRRETTAIGDIFIEQSDEALDWLAQMLVTLHAMRGSFPTQFLHVTDAPIIGHESDAISGAELMKVVDDEDGGADLLRLIVLATAADETGADDLLNHVRAEYETMRETLVRMAHVVHDVQPIPRATTQLTPILNAFGGHLERQASAIVSACRRYEFVEAWRVTRALRQDVDDAMRVVAHLLDDDGLPIEQAARFQAASRDWALQYVRLVTPFMPMFAEHIWGAGFRVTEAGSIFLSDWPFTLDGDGYTRRRSEEDVRRIHAFPMWLNVARAVADQAAEHTDADAIALELLGADEWTMKMYARASIEIGALVGRQVIVRGVSDVEHDDPETPTVTIDLELLTST